MGKTVYRFKTFKSDAAPFFFFINIFPPKARFTGFYIFKRTFKRY